MSSTEAQAGSFSGCARQGLRLEEARGPIAHYLYEWPATDIHDRLKEWSTANIIDGHVNDRLACGILYPDLTTKSHPEAASKSMQQFDQAYKPNHAEKSNAEVGNSVTQRWQPQAIEFNGSSGDWASDHLSPHTHGTHHNHGAPQRYQSHYGYKIVQSYDPTQGSAQFPGLVRNGNANRDHSLGLYQRGR